MVVWHNGEDRPGSANAVRGAGRILLSGPNSSENGYSLTKDLDGHQLFVQIEVALNLSTDGQFVPPG